MGAFKFAKTVMKSLFNKPATLMYPVVEREWQERTRGAVGIDTDNCILCGICDKKCPANAISVDRKSGKWSIERMQCIQCGYCVAECPKKCLTMEQKYTEPDAVKVTDTFDIEVKGASGGAGSDAADADLACNKDECVFCGLCAKVCPADALKVDRKSKTWELDSDACAKCGACIDKCPKKCLQFGGEGGGDAADASGDESLTCDKNTCVFCGLCAKACPVDALSVDRKAKTWDVDEDTCVKCGACIDKCPKKSLSFGAAPDVAPAAPAEPVYPELDAAECIYCRACENECPEGAILADLEDWQLDKDKCVGRGACIDVCPAEALKI